MTRQGRWVKQEFWFYSNTNPCSEFKSSLKKKWARSSIYSRPNSRNKLGLHIASEILVANSSIYMLDIISIHEKFQATFFFSITQIFNRTKASVVDVYFGWNLLATEAQQEARGSYAGWEGKLSPLVEGLLASLWSLLPLAVSILC